MAGFRNLVQAVQKSISTLELLNLCCLEHYIRPYSHNNTGNISS